MRGVSTREGEDERLNARVSDEKDGIRQRRVFVIKAGRTPAEALNKQMRRTRKSVRVAKSQRRRSLASPR